jgi:UDP:flavonoid glycosyltransferase YjiC (YdhE family)
MLAIPFLHDQHFIAKHIAQSNLGKAFLHPESLENKAIFSSSKLAERPSLNKQTLSHAILEILDHPEFYKENMRKIKSIPPQSFVEIIENVVKEMS